MARYWTCLHIYSTDGGFVPQKSEFGSEIDATINASAPLDLTNALESLVITEEPIEIYAYNCNKPIEYPSRHDNSAKPNTPKVDVSYIYNYGLSNYEQYISDQSVLESSLLNYYIDYKGIRDALTIATLASFDPSGGTKGGPSTSYSYSPDTKNKIDSNLSAQAIKKSTIDQNIIIPPGAMGDISGKVEDLLALPFYVRVDIGKPMPPPYSNELSDLEKKSKSIMSEMMEYAMQITSPGANVDFFKKRSFQYSRFVPNYANSSQTEFDLSRQIGTNSVILADVLDMTQNIINNDVVLNSSDPQVTFIEGESSADGCSAGFSFSSTKVSEFQDEVKRLLGKDGGIHNTYMDILEGQMDLYSTNILFYKISKFEDSDLETPIQNIFIPCDANKSQTYIDFQVKYGKRYVYKIYAYKLISGTEYTLSKAETTSNSAFLSEITEFTKRRDSISVKVKSKKDTRTYGFNSALDALVRDLNDMKTSEGKDKDTISQSEEDLESTKPKSEGLRAAIEVLGIYAGTDSTDNAGTYLSNTVAPVINGFLGTASESSSILTDTTKEKLKGLRTDIANYTDIGEQLLADLKDVLGKSGGFGKKKDRSDAAKTYIKRIGDFQEMEKSIIDRLAGIKDYQVDESDDSSQENTRYITALTYPTLELAEVPYYENAGTIIDNPPIFPDVQFVPYRGDSKNISFFINSGVGKLVDSPIVFSEQERAFYDTFREARKYNDLEPIEFISDESRNMAASFEIYRLASAPSTYADFSNALYKTLSENFKGGISTLSSVSYKEKISPNKTYYYMFRQRDERGAVSNPSSVFSVLLVDDGGVVFPIIEQYEFPDAPRRYEESARKLINLSPSINQVTPKGLPGIETYSSYEQGDKVNHLMGVQDEGLFGKTFKIRLTSKKTGRQIDLNVVFEAEVT